MRKLKHIHRQFQLKQESEWQPVIHLSTAKSWRGGEQQLVYLYDELVKSGIPQLIVCRKGSELAKRCEEKQRNYIAIPKRSSTDVFAAKKLKKICRYFNAGVIHTHDAHAHTTAFLSHSLFGNNTPIIVSRRVDFPIKNNKMSHMKYNYRGIAAILCVSDKIKEITARGVRDTNKLFTVYSGIDLSRFSNLPGKNQLRDEYNIPQDQLLIGNVSALAPHKDYFTFIDTVEKLPDLKATFFIIGEGELKLELNEYAKEKGVEERIIFTGFRTDILPVLTSLDIFLITSKTEGLGTSILDAFACGVPVVATKAGGIPELVEHEKTGLLADVGDSRTLAEQILRIANDKGLSNQLVKGAKQKLQQFTREQTAQKTLQVYERVMRM